MMMILQICSYDQVPTDVSGHVILGKGIHSRLIVNPSFQNHDFNML